MAEMLYKFTGKSLKKEKKKFSGEIENLEFRLGEQVGKGAFSICYECIDVKSNEIYLANDAIKSIIGENPRYIRPPYGAYSDATLTYADMVFINWSIDPLDWKYKNADTVYKNIISKAYDGAIILVHDLYGTSVDGALKAMDYLAKEGYAFVSIDEMAQLRGYNLQTHHLYNKFK